MNWYETYISGRDPNLRASDADREATSERLRRSHAEGRLDTNELQQRIDHCYQAKTVGELDQLVADLPREPAVQRPARRVRAWPVPLVPVLILILIIAGLGWHASHFAFLFLVPLMFALRCRLCGRYRRYGITHRSEHRI